MSTVLRIFVSSPGDVQEERDVLEEVVRDINNSDGEERGVQLKAFRWEKDVTPRIGPPPQKVVDDQTPDCQIYLGILSARFGTPADGFGSGTEKEFRTALKSWGKHGTPWILFYFNNDPPPLAEMGTDQVEQYLKVRRFRDELQKKGIAGSYNGGPQGFGLRASNHLRRVVRELAAPGSTPDDEQPDAEEIPSAYLEWLREECSDLDLRGLDVEQGVPARLKSLYVPLTTPLAKQANPEGKERPVERDEKPTLLLDLLDEQSLYVPGDPGSGKSTLCRWAAWVLSSGRLPLQDDVPQGYAESFPESLRRRLPLLVRLRDFWTALIDSPDPKRMSKQQLEQALGRWIEAGKPGDLSWRQAEAQLRQGTALLILDGMDEVPLTHGEGDKPVQPRSKLLSGLIQAVPGWIRDGNRVLLTSRPYGMTPAQAERMKLHSAPVAELPVPVGRLLAQRWFGILLSDSGKASARTQEMFRHVEEREGLSELFANPMMLTAACILFHQEKRLPKDLYDLYNRLVNNILFNRIEAENQRERIRGRLMVIAHGMHTGKEGLGEERTTPQAEAKYGEIDLMLRNYRQENPEFEPGASSISGAREELLADTGILLRRGEEKAAFYHLSFQEFLAAQRILELEFGTEKLAQAFLKRAARPEWRNTLRMLFASQGSRFSNRHSLDLVQLLIPKASAKAKDLGLLQVLADGLEVLQGRQVEVGSDLRSKFEQDCIAVIEKEAGPLPARHQLALSLGRLGDPRIKNDLRNVDAYVKVPSGDYALGEGDEKRKVTIQTSFLLSRFPVTNSQFRLFIEDGGYRRPDLWSETGRQWLKQEKATEPALWQSRRWNGPNQPVVGVCYWEAEAFSNWAGGRLPTEWEWEAAARGKNACQYPWCGEWKDGICNTDESGLGMTSAVGIFPRSASLAGLQDLSGNVWEWCRQDEEEKETDKGEIDALRPLRGGSWFNGRVDALPTFRYWLLADFRNDYWGFRVLLCVGPRTRSG